MKFQLFLLFLLYALIGCKVNNNAHVEQKPSELFSINGKSVSTDEFIYVYKKNNINNDSAYTRKDIQGYLDLYINFKLKIAEALSRGMDTTPAFEREFSVYREQLKQPYLTENKVTEELLSEAYERYQQEVKAAHILVKLEKHSSPADTLEAYHKIMGLREQALSGVDFGQLARKFSDDPSARSNDGELGYFTSFQMVYPFESAAYATDTGHISMPVRTQFGYHIVKVLDKRPSQGRVEVSHIMLRPGDDTDSVSLKNKIFEIYDQAVGGVPWDELVRRYSDDINTRTSGGRLKAFSVGQMPYSFQEAAFALSQPGDISDPVLTPFGWHIIRLERRLPLQKYEELEKTMRNRIARDSRAQLNKKALIERLKRENGFKESKAKKDILQFADSALMSGKWIFDRENSVLRQWLFTVGDKNYTVGDFLKYLKKTVAESDLTPEAYMLHQYNKFAHECIIQYEESHLAEKYMDYRMLVQEYREGILLFSLMEEEVWKKASEDSVGLRAFYKENIHRYQWGRRVAGCIYTSSRKDVLEEIELQIARGDTANFSKKELENRYNSKTALTLQIEEGVFEPGTHEIVEQGSFEAGTFMRKKGDTYHLLWVKEVLPPGPKNYSEVKGIVTSDYQDYVEKLWIKQLKNKYPVDINDRGLNYVYEVLEK